jgi:hypothetical protein
MEVIGGLNYLRVNRVSIESDPIGTMTPLVHHWYALVRDPIGTGSLNYLRVNRVSIESDPIGTLRLLFSDSLLELRYKTDT